MGLLSPYAMMGMAGGAQKGLQSFLDEESKTRLEEARLAAQEAMQIRAEGRKVAAAGDERKRQGSVYTEAQNAASGALDADREAYVRKALGLPDGEPVPKELLDEYSPKSGRGLLNRTADTLMSKGETDLAKDAYGRVDKEAATEESRLRYQESREDRQASNDRIERHHKENLDWQKQKFGERAAGKGGATSVAGVPSMGEIHAQVSKVFGGKDDSGNDIKIPPSKIAMVQDIMQRLAGEGKTVDPVRAYQMLEANGWKAQKAADNATQPAPTSDAIKPPADKDSKNTVKPPPPKEPTNDVVKMERAGNGLLGGKQFIVTYKDGTRKVVSGDDAERQYILMN